jgi:hypothetical protein
LVYYIDSEFYKDNNGDGVIHIPVLFGDDLTHSDAKYTYTFSNMLMYWLEKKGKDWYHIDIETKYSTVDEYLKELEKENYKYKVYKGDFLPLI